MPEMSGLEVAVVGAGNGGLAVAGYAGLGGARVRLYDIVAERIEPVATRGGIEVTGAVTGFASIEVATTNPAAALAGAELVVLVVTGPDQAEAARALTEHTPRSSYWVVKPGCTGGALEVRDVLTRGGRSDVTVGETDSFLFACSIPGPAASHISAIKQTLGLAVLPPERASELYSKVQTMFPQASLLPTVLHSGFTNMNAVAHVGPMLLNAGRIEQARGSFEFYGDGITESVARVVASYDEERVSAAAAYGVAVEPFREWVGVTYGISGSSTYEVFQRLQHEVYRSSPAPASLSHRYLAEDVPCGAVPTASLGRAAGVDMPMHESLVELASIVHGRDYWSVGRTAERLGLAGKDAAQITELVAGA
jgi:opine dehydrogenase